MKKILSVLKSPKTLVLACLAFTMPVFAADVSSPVQNKVCHDNQVLSAKLISKRAARTVLTGMCYSFGNATRQGSSSLTRFIGQSAITSSTWRR